MSQTNGFTQNADLYRTSKAHSELPDLELIEEHLPDLSGATCLDVATGTGHTAFFFARKQVHVFAVDINDEMLRVAQEESDRQTLSVRFLKSPADNLVFDDDNFELVTCRQAAHHFPNIKSFLAEVVRVLKPGGHLLLIDNVVPEETEAAEWLNGYEKARDESHEVCLSKEDWLASLEQQGFTLVHSERFPLTLDYTPWMERMSFDQSGQDAMWSRLMAAPEIAKSFWKPREDQDGKRLLTLQRQIFLAKI
ncbi:MAG: methyltransferase domain-containing protein [Candidatus Eremiobacteraeota bacterium]|nr:methyltransferase domain-containing protein [Candidatus Eremiobacteraeota bacterium]